MTWALILVAFADPTHADAEAPRVTLAARPSREGATLLLGATPGAVVREQRLVPLAQGPNLLEIAWAGTRLIGDSLELTPSEGSPALTVGGPVFPQDLPQTVRWEVDAAEAGTVPFTITYLMDGLSWQPEYTFVFEDTGKLSLSAVAVVRNDTGEDFEKAGIDLGLSAAVTADLRAGETLRLPYVEARGVAYEVYYLYDAAANADAMRWLLLRNTQETGLGVAPLPVGRVRLYEGPNGDQSFLGEVNLPHTPVGAKTEVALGPAREVVVERRVTLSRQVDQKMDVRGRLALYNQEEEISFLVENRKEEEVLLRIAERLDGEWKMLSNSHEFEKRNADRVEFAVSVPAHEEATVSYKVRRMNLLP